MSDEITKVLADRGAFLGFNGLEGLASHDKFWEAQPYGTRLYYGDGITEYLHRSILKTAIDALKDYAALQSQLSTAQATIKRLEVENKFHNDINQLAFDYDFYENIFYNNGHYAVGCNDVFLWGCADCEDVTPEYFELLKSTCEELEKLENEHNKDKAINESIYPSVHVIDLFCARKRGLRPQGAAYSYYPKIMWPLFNACGPKREVGIGNPYDPGGYTIRARGEAWSE